MPNVTATPRGFNNGQEVTEFFDTVGASAVTYTFQTAQEKLRVKNNGNGSVQVTVNGSTVTILPFETKEFYTDINSFTIVSGGAGVQSFEVTGINYKDELIPTSFNLFDKTNSGNAVGYFLLNGNLTANTGYYTSHNINVSPGETYTIRYGEANIGAFYRADGTFISKIGTTSGTAIPLTFTVPKDAAYMRVCGIKSKIETDMVVGGNSYPSSYQPIGKYLSSDIVASPLTKKIVSFNGDSICAGGTVPGGYGKIIANRNGMDYENIAVGGATIAGGTLQSDAITPRYWISRNISSMRADADYIILEGGVNDSSLGVALGTVSTGFGSVLDDTTFCGALENMFKQAILRWTGKKIGFVIVHRIWDDGNVWDTTYYPKIIQICEKWGIPYCDLFKQVPTLSRIPELKSSYTQSGDGWHPTEDGYRKFYVDKIEAWMRRL